MSIGILRPIARGAFVSLVFGLTLPFVAMAQAGWKEVQDGNALYFEGRYVEAHEKYLEALRAAPGELLIHFNDGNALYRNEELERAAEAYGAASQADNPTLASRAAYNLGNALYKREKLSSAIEAFKQSLRFDPSHLDAKHNLEILLIELDAKDPEREDQSKQDQRDGGRDRDGDASEDRNDEGPPPKGGSDKEREPSSNKERPRQLTAAEAQELLEAIQEDPNKIERQVIPPPTEKPVKNW